MTSRQLYDAVLIEINKDNAPNLILEDFNYFANKAVNQYVNKRYNLYDINQQTTDDLRVLKASSILDVHKVTGTYDLLTNTGSMGTYEVVLPHDYLHILNCICVYKVNKTFKCYDKGNYVRFPATRLTADGYSQVLENFWNRPTYKRPYYYIHNVNTSNTVPTDSYNFENGSGTDASLVTSEILSKILSLLNPNWTLNSLPTSIEKRGDEYYLIGEEGGYCLLADEITSPLVPVDNPGKVLTFDPYTKMFKEKEVNHISKYQGNNIYYRYNQSNYEVIGNIDDDSGTISESYLIPMSSSYNDKELSTTSIDLFKIHPDTGLSNVERDSGLRYGNTSQVRMEIRYGTDANLFTLEKVYVDYIKAPQNIRLTQEQLDKTEDTSQMLEWPDYVCQEIVNELVHLIMENIGDPKLQTHPLVTLSIATQQLTPVQAATAAQ